MDTDKTETVEEYLKRGQTITHLPAATDISETKTVSVRGNTTMAIGYGCYWIIPARGQS